MPTVNRAAVLTKLHKVLKKYYQPVAAPSRALLENVLYAACLENAPYAAADQAYQAVSTGFFDWNEVRVSTVKELAEVMRAHPFPQVAANNLRRSLQALFEANFSFDLEPMKKLTLGQAVQKISHDGVTPFAVAYVTQHSLGGHSVPLDSGAMGALAVLGLVEEKASPKDGCPGMERAIPKNKGIEFGSLLHQLAAEFAANPYSPNLHKILLEVDPEAKSRLPKRPPKGEKKPEPPAAPALAKGPKPEVKAEAKPDAKAKPDGKSKPEMKGKPEAKGKPSEDDKKKAMPPAAAGKKPVASPPAAKKPAAAPPAKKPMPEKKPTAKRKPR